MTVLFFIFVALAIFHFVWEGIIAPSTRLEIRYELFKLRDRLRRLKIECNDQIPDELFGILQRSINTEIRMLHNADIASLYEANKKFGDDKELLAEMNKIEKLIEECPIAEVKEIRDKSIWVLFVGFLVNCGGWAIYIIPMFIVLLSYGTVKLLIKKLVGLSDNDLNNMFPPKRQLPA